MASTTLGVLMSNMVHVALSVLSSNTMVHVALGVLSSNTMVHVALVFY